MRAAFIICASALAAAAASASPVPGAALWQARSGAYAVTWTAQDLTGRGAGGGASFSLRAYLRWVHRDELKQRAPGLQIEHRVRPVALAGRYLSIEDESYISQRNEAHPGGETRLRTFDLAAKGAARYRLVALTRIVPEEAIVKALAADPFVRSHSEGPLGTTIESVAEALRRGQGRDSEACYEVPDDLMTRFAIVGSKPSGVIAVHIGLPGSGPCRYAMTRIGLVLRPSIQISPVNTPVAGEARKYTVVS